MPPCTYLRCCYKHSKVSDCSSQIFLVMGCIIAAFNGGRYIMFKGFWLVTGASAASALVAVHREVSKGPP